MKIEHISMWVSDLEKSKNFYLKYFETSVSEKYINPIKDFSSYFISFGEGARIELMHRPDIVETQYEKASVFGLCHFAISIGSKEKVNELTEKLRNDGFIIKGEPRLTGDNYYESIVLDPEGNNIELTE